MASLLSLPPSLALHCFLPAHGHHMWPTLPELLLNHSSHRSWRPGLYSWADNRRRPSCSAGPGGLPSQGCAALLSDSSRSSRSKSSSSSGGSGGGGGSTAGGTFPAKLSSQAVELPAD